MKKASTLFLMLLIMAFGHSQENPTLKVKDKPIGLSSLDIEVEVIGNIATTTYDMLFYNPTNSVLEGEFSFPLGDGQNVSRFALDVNGKLREAVVVDKELGRIAFEQVVRRGIDPGLLEKGTGNNYKARIYPIPSKGYKRILIAYEQELVYTDDGHYYNLPLNFNNIMGHFKLEITVFDQKATPVIEKGSISGLEFKNWNKNYRTTIEKDNYQPNKSLLIKIPLTNGTQKLLTFEDYFYIYKTMSPERRLRKLPNKVTLYWDASSSMKDRNLEKELSLLNDYFNYLENVDVRFVSFSNAIITDKDFSIRESIWNGLKLEIQSTVYDGGTNYNVLKNGTIKSDCVLLFSDGVTTLSNIDFSNNKPVFVINSMVKSNHAALKLMAESSNGAYINLNTQSTPNGLSSLKYENFKFLGFTSNSTSLEVHPNTPKTVKNDFSVAGKNAKTGDIINLNFGYGKDIVQSFEIEMGTKEDSNKIVKRLWAQKKYESLIINSTKNKELITKLGTEYSLVTDYTSLIVLENVIDYVVYKIDPPEELKDQYNKILAQMEFGKGNRNETNLSDAFQTDEMDISITQRLQTPSPQGSPNMIDVVEDEEVVVMGYSTVSNLDEIAVVEETVVEFGENDLNDGIPFSMIEIPPTFPGCEGSAIEKKECFSNKIREHVQNNFSLQIANDLGLLGIQRINVLFTVNSKGQVVNIRSRAPHNRLEREIKRVIRLLPEMIAGKQSGKNVSVTYSLPVVFRMDDNGQTSGIEQEVDNPIYDKYSGQLKVNVRSEDTDYIIELKEIKEKEKAYLHYLGQRKDYLNTPSYFIDVSNYFKESFSDEIYAFRILSNIAEMDFDNYELLKVFAYQLQFNYEDDLAIFIYERILELRPEDSQSYRDLALAYEKVGKCQEAFDLFMNIIKGDIYSGNHRRVFEGMALIAKNEIKHLIELYRDNLNLGEIEKDLLKANTYDIRITVDWNHNDTDIDLHVIDPNLEECFFSHPKTKIGGFLSPDMTQGFGPEEFTLKNAVKGDYFIKIKYYGDRYQKIESPTFMKVTLYKYYGTKKESKETKIIMLTNKDDEEVIAKMSI